MKWNAWIPSPSFHAHSFLRASVGGVMIPVLTRFNNGFGGIVRPDLRGIRSKE